MEQCWQNLVMEFNRTFIRDNRWIVFWNGFKNTLLITVVAALIGIAIGVVVSVVHYLAESEKKKKKKTIGRYVILALDKVLAAYVSIMRGTPLAIQLTIMAFIIMAGFSNKIVVCCVAFGVNSGAYVSEVIRGGINSVDIGQMEAGRSLGFGFTQTMLRIILPQAIKNILPAIGNEFIAIVKETSMASTFFVGELMTSYLKVNGVEYLALEILIIVGAIYLSLTFTLSKIVLAYERRLNSK